MPAKHAHFIVGPAEDRDAGFVFTFLSENGTRILVSRIFESRADAVAAAGLMKLHAGHAERYQRDDAESGIASFSIVDHSGDEIAKSLDFSTRLARELAIERTLQAASTAPIYAD